MGIERTDIKPVYKRENGLFIIDIDAIKPPEDFNVNERSVVYIPPSQIGGNHRHPRQEIFIGIGELDFVWKDEEGNIHTEDMFGEKLKMFKVDAMTPHTVRNRSETKFGILIEFGSDILSGVEEIQLI